MFKDCKNIAGLWGSNFVGDWCVVLQCNRVFITLFKVPGCIIFWVRVTHKILEHCIFANQVSNSLALIMSKLIGGLACKDANTDPPKNNDDATVCQINL